MPTIFFPDKLDSAADHAIMRALPARVPTVKETAALARRLKVTGSVVDEGPLYSVRGEEAILHHFHASDSMRWSLLPIRGRTHAAEKLEVLDAATLRGSAEKFLARLGLLDKEAAFAGVTFGARESVDARSRTPTSTITRAYVNFSYTFEGLPVVGPGAKAQVEVGPGGAIVGCYRFWRSVATDPTRRPVKRPVIGWAAAQNLFRRDPAFAQLDESARVVVDRARLGYMALPPRDMQGVLFPVYEMRGSVSTRHIEKAPFRRYVVALEYNADDLKKYRVASQHFAGSCGVL